MSAVNNPSAVAAVPVMSNPQQPIPTNQQNLHHNRGPTRRPLPPHVDLNRMRAVELRARREIDIIEENAKASARSQLPLEPLPRTKSNVRSVKRTRQWRKQVEQILTNKILETVDRNRQLDEYIQMEREKDRLIKQEIAQLEKLPDVQQDLVQVDEVTMDQIMNGFIANMQPVNDSPNPQQPTDNYPPDVAFEQSFDELADSFIDCQLFSGPAEEGNHASADCEPTLNPKCVLPTEPHLPDLFGDPFPFDDDYVTL